MLACGQYWPGFWLTLRTLASRKVWNVGGMHAKYPVSYLGLGHQASSGVQFPGERLNHMDVEGWHDAGLILKRVRMSRGCHPLGLYWSSGWAGDALGGSWLFVPRY